MIPYGRQSVDDDDIAAVVAALRSDYLTTGPLVPAFESALAEYCGAKHAVAVSNGTAALHVAMLAADLAPGVRVLTSANTFLASANAAEFVGATADFADIDAETLCVSLDTLQSAWRDDVRAVVPVDFAGYPCVSRELAEWAHACGALVIEDASHAIGSARDGHRVGALPWVDMTTFSFHPVKTMTTGEGGAILMNDDRLAERCRRFRNHGMVWRSAVADSEPGSAHGKPLAAADCPVTAEHGPWFYEMEDVGFNYRLTDLQCALGLSQLRKLDQFIRRRGEIVAAYNDAFAEIPGLVCPQCPAAHSPVEGLPSVVAWHLYAIQVDFAALGRTRSEVMGALRERGVGTQVHYIPVHLQPYYRNRYGYGPGKCPVAERYYSRALSLPLYPAMTDADVAHVIEAMREACL